MGREQLKRKTNGRIGHYTASKNKSEILKNVRYIFKKKISLSGSGNRAFPEKQKPVFETIYVVIWTLQTHWLWPWYS